MPSPAHIRSTFAAIAAPPDELRQLRAFHKALADTTRLRLLHRLSSGPATVTELTEFVDLSQPLVSWHLRRLEDAGLIDTRRNGRETICSLDRSALDHFRAQERELLGLAG